MRMQPRHLDALIRQERYETEHREFLFAQMTAAVMQFSFNAPKRAVKLADLMPSRMKREPKPSYQSRDRVAANIGQIFSGFMGR